MQSLDTNVILRLLLNDIPEQTLLIKNLIAQSSRGSLVIADAALFETVWILSGPRYGLSRETIGRALLKITAIAQVKCNRRLVANVLPLYIKHPKLSFVDICLTIYAEAATATPLLTFDKNLAKQLPAASLITKDLLR